MEEITKTTLLEQIQNLYGEDTRIIERRPVSGGDINETYVLELSNRKKAFLKTNRGKTDDFFEAEAAGLKAIAATNTIRTAKVLACGRDGADVFLLFDYIKSGSRSADFWEVFGHGLADMHKADTTAFVPNGRFGFLMNNYIGATRQINTPCDSWIDFYRKYRLEVQFRMADHCFDDIQRKRISSLLDRLDTLLIEPEQPSLLHGDLWSGNFMVTDEGGPVLIDPAVYVGHPEADLAMTELFGGFHDAFYSSYENKNPLQPGYADRRDLYHLYQLLNHLNLFGGSYYSSVVRILNRYS